MNKAFTKEDEGQEPLVFRSRFQPLPAGFRNLITARGSGELRDELAELLERLAEGAEDGAADTAHLPPDDRKKLLRLQIEDLSKRLDTHEVIETPAHAPDRVVFGATVTVRDEDGQERRYQLVGLDESSPENGRISWTSPLARALLNQRVGSLVKVASPKGDSELEILGIEGR